MLAGKLSDRVRTWIELDKRAAKHNYQVFRKILLPKTELWAVVKSNAYGHGLFDFSRLVINFGVDGLCVDSISEGLALRREKIKKPILVLGPSLFNLYGRAAKENLMVTVPNFYSLKMILSGKNVPDFHIKFDTGMHRQGFYAEEVNAALKLLAKSKKSRKLKGVYTHFAYASNKNNYRYTESQFKEFQAVRNRFIQAGFKNLIFHAAATGGALLNKKYHLNAVRIGLGLYGIYPNRKMASWHKNVLRPVLSWRTLVADVKTLRPGARIGYDLTEKTNYGGRMAVLPVGYWHGLPWSLSGKGEVLVRGHRAKILGRVSMDLTVVDVSRIPVSLGEEVTLIGRDCREEISAWDVADKADTMAYEIVTRLNPLIKKITV